MDKLKWIWLQKACGVGSTEVLTLMSRLGSIDKIYSTDTDGYISLGISERTAERLSDKSLDDAYSVAEWCSRNGVEMLTPESDRYPISLRALPNPPAVLYCMGKLPQFNESLCISVVGTRSMSEYGMRAAYKISYEIAAAGIITVSGMALGIDGVSACATIAAGGRAVAVLGCGVDIVYPREHATLEKFILESGAVISEYPPSSPPHGYHFPVRNRIISGLSVGTLVVDAPEKSGSLITAKNAIMQGKDIYAVPGNIDGRNTSGTNALIRDGATAVLCGRDIVRNYTFLYEECINMKGLDQAEGHSELDASMLMKMGISLRTARVSQNSVSGGSGINVSGRNSGRNFEKKPAIPPADGEDGANSAKGSVGVTETKFEADTKIKSKIKLETKSEIKSETKSESKASGQARADDRSRAQLESLSERQRAIFDEIPLDRPVLAETLTRSGYSMGEVMSALTILEIKGLVASLPGAQYIRK